MLTYAGQCVEARRLLLGWSDAEADHRPIGFGDNAAVTLAPPTRQPGFWGKKSETRPNTEGQHTNDPKQKPKIAKHARPFSAPNEFCKA